jgi:hypothetical protein
MANYQQTIDVDNNGFTKGKMRTLIIKNFWNFNFELIMYSKNGYNSDN